MSSSSVTRQDRQHNQYSCILLLTALLWNVNYSEKERDICTYHISSSSGSKETDSFQASGAFKRPFSPFLFKVPSLVFGCGCGGAACSCQPFNQRLDVVWRLITALMRTNGWEKQQVMYLSVSLNYLAKTESRTRPYADIIRLIIQQAARITGSLIVYHKL